MAAFDGMAVYVEEGVVRTSWVFVYWQDEDFHRSLQALRVADVRLHHQGGITARSLRNFVALPAMVAALRCY
jgi:hypothetical protein